MTAQSKGRVGHGTHGEWETIQAKFTGKAKLCEFEDDFYLVIGRILY